MIERLYGNSHLLNDAGQYLDDGSGGPENDFTNRNTTFMTWNLLHLARLLKDAGGIPAHAAPLTDTGRLPCQSTNRGARGKAG